MTMCLGISFVWIASIFAVAKAVEQDKWVTELTELKLMLTTVNSKLSSLESKLTGLQVLEYAFKVNSLDSSLRNVDLRISQMAAQMDTMKDTLKTSCSDAQQESANARRGGEVSVSNNVLMEKIDDYAKKTKSGQDELFMMAELETKELNVIKNISRTGFSKLYQKVDNVLAMEGQMMRLSQTVRGLTPKFTQISEQVNDLAKGMNDVKQKVELNSGKLQNITALTLRNNKTSDSTKRILQIANNMKSDMSEFEENAATVKNAIETAKQLERDIRGKVDGKNTEKLKKLIKELDTAETAQVPLLSKFTTNYRDLDILLRGSSANTVGEFSALIDAIKSNMNCSGGQSSGFVPIGDGSSSLQDIPQRLFVMKQGANQQDIFDKLSYVRSTISSIQNDARKYCNNDPSNPPNNRLGLVIG